jgi:hypothetical protein
MLRRRDLVKIDASIIRVTRTRKAGTTLAVAKLQILHLNIIRYPVVWSS